jgi:hypothetical protein
MSRNRKFRPIGVTDTWRQYEEGKEYKRRINLYNTVNENERFYRGDQWHGVNSNGLSTPVFNIVKRIINHLVNSVASTEMMVVYSDENIPYVTNEAEREEIADTIKVLNQWLMYRWEKCKMETLLRKSLLDAAVSGDGVFYSYWDTSLYGGQSYTGDLAMSLIDNVNLFLADVNTTDIQSQEYIILAGRANTESLRREAIEYGIPDADVKDIKPDDNTDQAGDYAAYENTDTNALKSTYLIKFYRDDDGYVVWEKSVRNTVICSVTTETRMYPVAYYNWESTKNSCHGTAPITGLIQNQKYINKAYAMAMKHMVDTAFSKVIYDKKLIPEWTNEVGQAIGIVSGGDVSNAVKVIGTGDMQNDFMPLLENTMDQTKSLMGATDAAIGEVMPNNTSAILALQEASAVTLETIRKNLYQCIEDIANIWIDMMCAYYNDNRRICYRDDTGTERADCLNIRKLKDVLIRARVDVEPAIKQSQVTLIDTLGKLLNSGHITFSQYLERLPDGIIPDKQNLISENEKEKKSNGRTESMGT